MSPFRRRAKFICAVNVHLLLGCGLGFIAWSIWPQEPEWWGLGLIAIILSVGSLGELIKALRIIAGFIARERVLTRYEAQGGKPKSAQMASLADLQKAGMLDE
jgi:hypothetical protein